MASCKECAAVFSGPGNRRYCDPCSAKRKALKAYSGCSHPKPRFSNGRERRFCFACCPKPEKTERKTYSPKKVVIATCEAAGCGEEFIRIVPGQRYCCTKCRTRTGNTSERKLDYDRENARGPHRHRARRYGGAFQSFSVLSVLDRDGWKCRACGIDTPKGERGKFSPNAPELDHAIPLARGGDHTPENTQCLCRSCNSAKADRTMEEFMEWLRT